MTRVNITGLNKTVLPYSTKHKFLKELSNTQAIEHFIKQIHFPFNLDDNTLFQNVYDTLTHYFPISYFGIIHYPQKTNRGKIAFQIGSKTNNNSSIIDYYLKQSKLAHSEQLALINYYLSKNQPSNRSWLLQAINIESSSWLLLQVPKNKQNTASLFLSHICNTLSLHSCKKKYDQQTIEQHLINKYLQEPHFLKSTLYDPLTGLANRILMTERLEQSLIHQNRHKNKFAVLFIDLDNFKPVNDNLGHHIGDEVLKQAAHNIKQSIRANDLASRWGGDEFVILLDSIRDKAEVELITKRIYKAFLKTFTFEQNTINLSCSIGCNIIEYDHYSSAINIIKDADKAMYQAKQQLGLSIYYFKKKSLPNIKSEQLSKAIKQHDIFPHYQPMIQLSNHQLFGFEVMARWKSKQQALKNACDFIPLAEKSGLIAELDMLILKQAIKQLTIWNHSFNSQNIRISVNLSGHHLEDPSGLQKVCSSAAEHGVLPSQLVFEFSEKDVVTHNGQASKTMSLLHEQGILIGLDGFGTGSSSLNALFNYPIDYIKVHQSYTHKMLNSSRDLALIRAIRDMSNDLGFHLIIEGIETKKQHDKLIEIGCEFGQGHFIAHPMQQESISKFLN